MPRKLTALANAGASNSASLSATKAVIHHLDKQLEEEQLKKDGGLIVRMRDYLTLMREVVDGTKRRNDYLKELVQAQVQMVQCLPTLPILGLTNVYLGIRSSRAARQCAKSPLRS
jgi:uncharacterized protein involved in propanediol utilization